MLFKKLFQILVLGGAVVGTNTACTTRAEAQTAAKKGMKDGGMAADAGAQAAAGGVKGW
jgi:hypothetical protein